VRYPYRKHPGFLTLQEFQPLDLPDCRQLQRFCWTEQLAHPLVARTQLIAASQTAIDPRPNSSRWQGRAYVPME